MFGWNRFPVGPNDTRDLAAQHNNSRGYHEVIGCDTRDDWIHRDQTRFMNCRVFSFADLTIVMHR